MDQDGSGNEPDLRMKRLFDSKAIPPFAALRAFEAVGRLGGVRKAALALAVDHAVVSRHVRMIENWTGVPLFERSGGHLNLTAAGTKYHAQVSNAIFELAAATSELRGDENQGVSIVWCIPGFAAQWVYRQLADFMEKFPHYKVELRPTDSIANLEMHEADVDIRFYGDDWPPEPGGKGLKHVELARPLVIPVASPEVASRLSELSSVSDLANEEVLLHTDNPKEWPTWLRLNGVEVSGELPGSMLWHAHIAIAAACQGRGVALANNYLVGEELARGELVEVVLPDARPVVLGAYFFVARENRWSSPPIAQFRRFLQTRAVL